MSIREGFGLLAYVVGITLVSCLLLAINGVVVGLLYPLIAADGPVWSSDPRVIQMAYYVLPVFMLVGQWWLVDVVQHACRRK